MFLLISLLKGYHLTNFILQRSENLLVCQSKGSSKTQWFEVGTRAGVDVGTQAKSISFTLQ